MKIRYICFGIVKQNILQKNPPIYPLGKGNWAADQHATNILNFLPFSWSCDQEWSYFQWFEKNSRIHVCFACHIWNIMLIVLAMRLSSYFAKSIIVIFCRKTEGNHFISMLYPTEGPPILALYYPQEPVHISI